MSFNFEIESNASVRLKTAGKYCDRDIIVTAKSGGGGNDNLFDSFLAGTLEEVDNATATSIKKYTFDQMTSLKKAHFPNVITVGEYAFNGCSNLSDINMPKVETCGINAFYGIAAKSIEFPELLSVPNNAFAYCPNLTYVRMQKAITLSFNAFYTCQKLNKADFENVQSIQSQAFKYTDLTTLIIRTPTVCSLQNTNAFDNTSIPLSSGNIYVPAALIDSYKSATNWSKYASKFRAIEDYPEICEI